MEGSYCPECGSWERECSSETPVDGCICQRCARVTIDRLTRERDEARAETGRVCQSLLAAADERDRLRALLREAQWAGVVDCQIGHGWARRCPWCGACEHCGHALDCRLKAALEG